MRNTVSPLLGLADCMSVDKGYKPPQKQLNSTSLADYVADCQTTMSACEPPRCAPEPFCGPVA